MSDSKLPKKSILSFLQANTNVFWDIENAIEQNEIAHEKLLRARENASVVIRSMRQAFPEAIKSIDMIQADTIMPLEIEQPCK